MAGLSQALARVLRERREAIGLSQEELADRAGLHRTYISLIERGERRPTVDVLDRLARGLAMRASALLVQAERAREK